MNEPPYLRIVASIRRRIAVGELRPGDRVPSTRQIARESGVALATAARALATLARDGDVRPVPRVGTVVAAQPGLPAQPGLSVQPGLPAHPGRSARLGPAAHGESAVPSGAAAAAGPSGPSRPAGLTGPATRPRTGGEPELSRDRIVRAAIAVADAEGLAAVSMRRVATELGVATMSLYRHVAGKDDLVMLMSDAVFGEAVFPDPPPADWRARLEGLTRMQWALCRAHPWLARTISLTRPLPVPNGMAHTEYAMRAVDGLGLDPVTTVRIAITLAGHLQAMAMNLEQDVEAEQDTGMTSEEWMDANYPETNELMGSGRFPLLATLGDDPGMDLDLDTLFEFGLQLLLNGVAELIDGRSPG